MLEGELKKASNNEETVQAKIKSKKEELMTSQMNNMNSQKAIDTAKMMINQKKTMLTKMNEEFKQAQAKKDQYEQAIRDNKQELDRLEQEKSDN